MVDLFDDDRIFVLLLLLLFLSSSSHQLYFVFEWTCSRSQIKNPLANQKMSKWPRKNKSWKNVCKTLPVNWAQTRRRLRKVCSIVDIIYWSKDNNTVNVDIFQYEINWIIEIVDETTNKVETVQPANRPSSSSSSSDSSSSSSSDSSSSDSSDSEAG